MPFSYTDNSGNLRHNGAIIGRGYSGHGPGVNNPAMQRVVAVGPIPPDVYKIGKSYTDPHRGPMTMRLTPKDGHAGDAETHRDGFLIHADAIHFPGKMVASEGCIILSAQLRLLISRAVDAGDDELTVIAEEMVEV